MKWEPYFVEKEINQLTKKIGSLYNEYNNVPLFHMGGGYRSLSKEEERKIKEERKSINRQIEILENLLRIEEKKLEAITAYYLYRESDEEDEDQKTPKTKNSKTSSNLTHKQQMVLLDQLDFLNATIFKELTIEGKAVILGNLLNRNIQETRELLTYYNDPKGTHKKFSNTTENNKEVTIMLEQNGLTLTDK